MSEIQGGRWDSGLRRLFPVKGSAIAPAVAPEIVPTIQIQPDRMNIWSLSGVKTYGCRWARGGAAGAYSVVTFENPADSQSMVEVRELRLYNSVATNDHYLGWADARLVANAILTAPLDDRFTRTGAGSNSQLNAFHGTIAAPTIAFFGLCHCQQDFTEVWQHPIVIPPGSWLCIRSGSVNEALYGCATWEETPASPAEITLGY